MDDFTKKRIQKVLRHYMESTIGEQLRSKRSVGFAFDGDELTMVEQRPSKDGTRWIELPVAQFRLDAGGWRVYGLDSGGSWHLVPEIPVSENFERQLERVTGNDLGIF
ncbi:DUF3024 domain-containing protein [Saccharibacillus sp. CPCC 101409]|uniref:DUF3024 domain-containing protein n=1 Tax=Saccharibacillus sp. CPCC 101409 TaxID=3058041 RepID=UPI002671BC5B|nr:DUF3024 domain-containing protein [Saccharibacillus sp. CPCC 101409]MDO3410479.1 DUF3024 domain-containing protein [Saccharibacillus sp. CPCC 101409]